MNPYKFKHFYKNKYILSKLFPNKYYLCYNYKYKVIWYRVAKVGSRTIDSHFRKNTPENEYIYSSQTAYNPSDFENYFKFGFVRHPQERIVSAWKNKVVDSNYFQFTESQLNKMQNFDSFIDWLSNIDLKKSDEHLRLQSTLIDLNNVDFIGRMENFNSDFKFIADKIGLPLSDIFIKNQSNKNEFKISEKSISAIKEMYKIDYQIFYHNDL